MRRQKCGESTTRNFRSIRLGPTVFRVPCFVFALFPLTPHSAGPQRRIQGQEPRVRDQPFRGPTAPHTGSRTQGTRSAIPRAHGAAYRVENPGYAISHSAGPRRRIRGGEPWVRDQPFRGLTAPHTGWRTLGARSAIPRAHGAAYGVENPGYADYAKRARLTTGPLDFALAPATPE